MPVDIHGKKYTTVAERMILLEDQTKGAYSLTTEIVEHADGLWVVKSTLTIDGKGTYTGHAYEKDGSSLINRTSALETCETSSIGRALAAAGFHGSEFCTAEEIVNAINNQNPDEKASAKQIAFIKSLFKSLGMEDKQDAWLKKHRLSKFEDCSSKLANETITTMKKQQEGK